MSPSSLAPLTATTWLAADDALPQRDALLDTGLAAERMGRLIGTRGPMTIERCDRLRVNYQIGKSLRVLYRVEAAGLSWTIAARTFRDGRAEGAYHDARDHAVTFDLARLKPRAPCPLRPVFYDAELSSVFWVFPNDRKIAGLAAVARGSVSPREELSCTWRSTRLVAYAPEKSATLACLDDAGAVVAYAKVAAQDQAESDYHTYRALGAEVAGNPRLRLPRALGYLPQHRTLVLEAIAGRRMADPAGGADAMHDAAGLGAALAVFHSCTPPSARPFTRFAGDRLVEARRLIACVRPDVDDLAVALVRELGARRRDDREPPVCLHGDVHPKNAIVTDRAVALIDVEDLAIGPAAADLGSFLAALMYLRRANRLDDDTHAATARAFLGGYASVRPLPARLALGWHTAAALFVERALRAVTRVRPLGLLHLPELLRDAQALLTERRQDEVERRTLRP